uniref:Uncharacterized protein n=1 Tax=Glossina pallidipes TaxID=7398 RepID=A0A1A9ZTY5_GLOPL
MVTGFREIIRTFYTLLVKSKASFVVNVVAVVVTVVVLVVISFVATASVTTSVWLVTVSAVIGLFSVGRNNCTVILLTGDLGGVIDTTKSTSSSSWSRSSSPTTARQSLSRPLLDESC